MIRLPPISTLHDTRVPYTTLFRSGHETRVGNNRCMARTLAAVRLARTAGELQPKRRRSIAQPALRPSASPPLGRPGFAPGIHAKLSRCAQRSEEHTSEIQSLMRISYAFFCLIKKNTKKKITV